MAEFEAGEWPVDYGQANCRVFEKVPPLPEGEVDPELEALREVCENVAVNLLWNFTGRIFGTREVFLRPIRTVDRVSRPTTFEGRGPMVNYPVGQPLGWMPVMIAGSWYNLRCGVCPGACVCEEPWSIKLPQAQATLEVVIDGTPVPPEEYWLDGDCLIRKESSWPTRQNLRREAGEPGTWSVRYEAGLPVPKAGEYAAGVLACELGKAARNDSSCQLPQRVQSITRQGVTMAILDTFEDLEKGRTGIPSVDMWVQSVRTKRSAARPPVSPDSVDHRAHAGHGGYRH